MRAAGARRIVVDLAAASFIDSTVVGVLRKTLREVEAENGTLLLVLDDVRVLRMLELAGLNRVFRIVPSLTEAVEVLVAQ